MSPRQLSTGPHFITTSPSVTACRGCRSPLLAATVGGFDYRVDPTALAPGGELVALLDGRATFELHGELLMRRGVDHIRAERSAPVLAEHRCGPIPDEYVDHVWLQVAALLVIRLLGGTPVLPDQPPF